MVMRKAIIWESSKQCWPLARTPQNLPTNVGKIYSIGWTSPNVPDASQFARSQDRAFRIAVLSGVDIAEQLRRDAKRFAISGASCDLR